MATATKTQARRAASKTGAAPVAKTTRARGSNARALQGASKVATTAANGAVHARTGAVAAKKMAVKRAPGALNGDASRAPKVLKGSARAKQARGGSNGSVRSNGALPEALAGDIHERELDALHDGEVTVVRKSQVVSDSEAGPVQIDGLAPEVTRPAYWDKACADLVKRDRILKKLIPKFGPVHLLSRGDPFVTLARSVVGQQVSVAAAQAAWQRVESACPKLVPQQFIKLGQEKLLACGLSKRKTEYILDLAQHFVSGALHVGKWTSMEDEAVIAELTQIRGIGRWTAEMFLIFNLSRPDVLPLDDLGLIRAISVNYFSGEPVTRSEAREVAANWEPWRTVATWYMWRSLDPLPVDY
ncbi:DNA repair protein [Paraburkholderia acidicola]|uniref:DNA-3-methyladenine glycosylase II n=1 Tax=Paraburkholderia acidicola TaxID=1912599 RepID=A0A2A4F3Q8_9BURK|nr:DNA-3-methyladenine glycosylase [Paraburkholderia acidicola]PCE27332.1 DNA repair protein [Paraburkholderia acidicola]